MVPENIHIPKEGGCKFEGVWSHKPKKEGWEGMGILWNKTIKCEFLSEFMSCNDIIFLCNNIIIIETMSILCMHLIVLYSTPA